MARKQFTGEGRVDFVPTIADPSAPTVAELAAGTPLTGQLTGDGIPNIPLEGSTIDISDGASKFNKTAPGTFGGQQIEMMLYRDSETGSETAYTALPRDTAGFIVIRRYGGSTTAFAAADVVEVAQGTVITRENQKPARNEPEKYRVQFTIEAEPQQDAVVVA